ncbi:hypothetical protein [Jeotgalibacillus soli]|uniref:Uncharacterized protein n=1 Tax=Jeotgalibacillus soli TaxID=889306 RepID=A0A0C2RVC3_9BACL|nr:hypothetical protein [Jeotgalibacillus soli]KIL45704.1 hypothetical protein KP78_20530 [Jeotgalibacillus soli]
MRKKVWLNKTIQEASQLVLQGESTDVIGTLNPSGQMVVDSDELAFVYLAEEGDEFTYLYLPDFIWPELKMAVEADQNVVVRLGRSDMTLLQLKDELAYLVSNIEGNGNYGEAMVQKVESVFLANEKMEQAE